MWPYGAITWFGCKSIHLLHLSLPMVTTLPLGCSWSESEFTCSSTIWCIMTYTPLKVGGSECKLLFQHSQAPPLQISRTSSLGFLYSRPGQSTLILWKLTLLDCRLKAQVLSHDTDFLFQS